MREARGVKKRQRAVADVHVGRKWISFARQTREKILFLSTYSAVGTSLSAHGNRWGDHESPVHGGDAD